MHDHGHLHIFDDLCLPETLEKKVKRNPKIPNTARLETVLVRYFDGKSHFYYRRRAALWVVPNGNDGNGGRVKAAVLQGNEAYGAQFEWNVHSVFFPDCLWFAKHGAFCDKHKGTSLKAFTKKCTWYKHQ